MAVGFLRGTLMVVVCPVCRDVVHTSSGYILRHGAKHHGMFLVCAGSGTIYCCNPDECCGV